MARTYGRAPLGQRAIGAVPHGHWQTSTFLAALRCDAVTAPCVIDGPINGADVPGLYRAVPGPHLGGRRRRHHGQSRLPQGPASAHRHRAAPVPRCSYLPPYSPDLNPIEQLFAKLKALLRKAATRSLDALWAAVGTLLDRFSPRECARYFTNAGYRSLKRNSQYGVVQLVSSAASMRRCRALITSAGTALTKA